MMHRGLFVTIWATGSGWGCVSWRKKRIIYSSVWTHEGRDELGCPFGVPPQNED
jgi:hypothetical protein